MKKGTVIVLSLFLSGVYSWALTRFFFSNASIFTSVLLDSDSLVMLYWCQLGVFQEASSIQSLKQMFLDQGISVLEVDSNDLIYVVLCPSTDRSEAVLCQMRCKEMNVDALLKEGVMTLKQKQRFENGDVLGVLKEVMSQ